MCFTIFEEKNAFLGYENNPFKTSKNWHFSKEVNSWLTHGFGPTIGQENVFCVILEQKNAFLGYKNNKFKKPKNWHFFKGVNPWFSSKNGHFSHFFKGNIGQKNDSYDVQARKNAFVGYKNNTFKK